MKKFLINCKLFIKKHYKAIFCFVLISCILFALASVYCFNTIKKANAYSIGNTEYYSPYLDYNMSISNDEYDIANSSNNGYFYYYGALRDNYATISKGVLADDSSPQLTEGILYDILYYNNEIQFNFITNPSFVPSISYFNIEYNNILVPYNSFLSWLYNSNLEFGSGMAIVSSYIEVIDKYGIVRDIPIGQNGIGSGKDNVFDEIADSLQLYTVDTFVDNKTVTDTLLTLGVSINNDLYIYLSKFYINIEFTESTYLENLTVPFYNSLDYYATDTDNQYYTEYYLSSIYNQGVSKGLNDISNNPLRQIFHIVSDFFNLEIFPNFTFGFLLMIIFGLIAISITIKLFLGG